MFDGGCYLIHLIWAVRSKAKVTCISDLKLYISLLFTGSGCARGFLGCFDAAWATRSWASGRVSPLQVLAERESVYMLLSQTTPESMPKSFNNYTINPKTR